jgi:LmbE family N-acetylglucosaminyl deacetylase
MKKIVVVSVHPDDETLGCAGTLLKHREQLDEIYWLIITSAFEHQGFTDELIQKRAHEIKQVTKLYCFNEVFELNFPTGTLDEIPFQQLIGAISGVFRKIQPNIVYLPFKGDIHSDHRVVFETAYSCTKSFRYPSIEKVLMMETISETDFAPAFPENAFIPNYYVDISDFFSKKVEILNIFESEIQEHPFPRSIKAVEALALLRGAQSGCNFAESFMLIKEIFR